MTRMVIGTSKNPAALAVVRDVTPDLYRTMDISSQHKFSLGSGGNIIDFAARNVTSIDKFAGYMLYANRLDVTDLSTSLSTISNIASDYCCYGMYYGCSNITGNVDLSSVDCIYIQSNCCSYMFYGCSGITSVDLSNMRFVNGSYGCQNMFHGCTSLNSVDMGNCYSFNASNIGTQMFSGCTSLKTIRFNSLKLGNYSAFIWGFSGSGIEHIYFPSAQSSTSGVSSNFFDRILYNTTGVTIHFPKNLDPQSGSNAISRMSGYPNFGGTDSILAFDLPSTLILSCANSSSYKRNPNFDTATSLAWILSTKNPNESVELYTNSLNDPQVGDTIYSDAACTTAVTTIDSIA